jgi:two-component system OmpR family sensor kinase
MSLRSRLLAGMAVVAVVLVAAAFVITSTTHAYLVDQVDSTLEAANSTLRNTPPGLPQQGGFGVPNLNRAYVFKVNADGTLATYDRPGLGETSTPDVPPKTALRVADDVGSRPFTVGSSSGSVQWRVLAIHMNDGDVYLVALSLHDVTESVNRVIRLEALATALILAILAMVTFFVIRLGLRPIKQMTATATTIAGGDLSHRVPEGATGTEAGELGVALNTMMTKIEDAFEQRTALEARLRQFIADASHELRTPVTTIRGYAELYRSGGLADPDDMAQAMRRTEQEAVRMGTLVEDLLLLARLDQGRALEVGAVDLGVLAVDAVSDARAVDPTRSVTAAVAEGVRVDGDEGRLRQVVANLVANALVHTPDGTPIEVRVTRDGSDAVLEVCDHGPGMAQPVADRAFERFFRADPARSRHAGGSGLGLSIVKAIVHAHDGTVAIMTGNGAGTTVRVTLPLM